MIYSQKTITSYRTLALLSQNLMQECSTEETDMIVKQVQHAIQRDCYLYAAYSMFAPCHAIWDKVQVLDPYTLSRPSEGVFFKKNSASKVSLRIISFLQKMMHTFSKPFMSDDRTPTELFYKIIDHICYHIAQKKNYLEWSIFRLEQNESEILSHFKEITLLSDEAIEILFFGSINKPSLHWWYDAQRRCQSHDDFLEELSHSESVICNMRNTLLSQHRDYWHFLNQEDRLSIKTHIIKCLVACFSKINATGDSIFHLAYLYKEYTKTERRPHEIEQPPKLIHPELLSKADQIVTRRGSNTIFAQDYADLVFRKNTTYGINTPSDLNLNHYAFCLDLDGINLHHRNPHKILEILNSQVDSAYEKVLKDVVPHLLKQDSKEAICFLSRPAITLDLKESISLFFDRRSPGMATYFFTQRKFFENSMYHEFLDPLKIESYIPFQRAISTVSEDSLFCYLEPEKSDNTSNNTEENSSELDMQSPDCRTIKQYYDFLVLSHFSLFFEQDCMNTWTEALGETLCLSLIEKSFFLSAYRAIDVLVLKRSYDKSLCWRQSIAPAFKRICSPLAHAAAASGHIGLVDYILEKENLTPESWIEVSTQRIDYQASLIKSGMGSHSRLFIEYLFSVKTSDVFSQQKKIMDLFLAKIDKDLPDIFLGLLLAVSSMQQRKHILAMLNMLPSQSIVSCLASPYQNTYIYHMLTFKETHRLPAGCITLILDKIQKSKREKSYR